MKQSEGRCGHYQIPAARVNRSFVLLLWLLAGVQCFCNAQTKTHQNMTTIKDDEAAIRALEDRFAAAVNAGDVDAIMKNYIPDKSLVVFDLVPRKEYHGADAYRQDWVDFYTHYKGLPKFSIVDLNVTVDGNIAFSYSFTHITGTDMQGRAVDKTVRVTAGYRKVNGSWLKVLEHISVPVDPKTGKGQFNTKP